jgi:signal transduction histidine kinase
MPGLHNVDFYLQDTSGDVDSSISGFSVGKAQRPTYYRNPSMEFSSASGNSFTAYIRIKSQTTIILPVFIREKSRYIDYDRTREFALGLYFGAIFILAIYHFYLFLTTSDRGYLWLTLFSVTYALSQMTAMYGYLIDWGITSPGSLLSLLHIVYFLAVFFGIVLSRYFIQSQKYTPIFDKILKSLQIASLTLAIVSPFLGFMLSDKLFLVMKITPLPLYIYCAIKAYLQGYRPALNYLIATTSFIIGIAIYNSMYGFGILPCNTFIYFIPNATVLITLTLYSISIAHKINTYKKEQEVAREQVLIELEEKLKIQGEMAKIEGELQQAKKMETIGRLLSGVAHDMKNLLNPIQGYTSLIRKESRGNEAVNKHVSSLASAVNNLNDLSTTLLDITRKDRIETTLIDLNAIVVQTGSLLKHSSPKGITVTVVKSEIDLHIPGDPGMIHSAIINLGLNGIDAISGDGTITITVSKVHLSDDNPECKKNDIPGGIFASIAVKDTGLGISSDVREHLFEPYYTTKLFGKGTGLGLMRVYNCIKLHKGCISIESIEGKGSEFTLYFPMGNNTLQCNTPEIIPKIAETAPCGLI